jgi:membrane-bound metal-dependent hydrolase YbcI (DUF457 family)
MDLTLPPHQLDYNKPMTPATHTAVGFLIVKTLDTFGVIPPEIKREAYAIGIFAANLPDFDILYFRKIKGHRDSLFHAPIFWLLITLSLFLFSISFRLSIVYLLTLIFFLGLFSHFILDSIDSSHGIPWLGPFKKNKYSINEKKFKRTENSENLLQQYLHHPNLIIDIVVCTIALLSFLFIK